MTTGTHPAAGAAGLRALSDALLDATNAARGVAKAIRAWIDARERAAADRETLASMSDRELLDIGMDRAQANAIANGSRVRERLC